MYKVVVNKAVSKFLKKHGFLEKPLLTHLKKMKKHGLTHKDILKLKGDNEKYRLRIGKYRFLIRHKKNTILIYVYDAKSRGDVY